MQKESNKVLVIDVSNPACDGKLTDRDFLNGISHTLLPVYELVKKCEALGIKCVTPEAVIEGQYKNSGKQLLLVSHLVSARTEKILENGIKPLLLFCQESPMIATRFYANFRKISRRFTYTMAFSGMQKQAHLSTTFIPMHFPIYFEQNDVVKIPFETKKLLALVAANKSAPSWKAILMKLYYGSRVKLIYPVRKRFVEGLAKIKSIDLYGKGWDTDRNESVRSVYKGLVPADGKLDTLAKYKFTLCFENAIFPGYVTEKLFDALLAGSVPVYLGDPYIFESVPNNTFVDARTFKNITDLHQYLDDMPEDIYEQYRKAGQDFLTSPAFKDFDYKTFAGKVLNLIENYEQH